MTRLKAPDDPLLHLMIVCTQRFLVLSEADSRYLRHLNLSKDHKWKIRKAQTWGESASGQGIMIRCTYQGDLH